MELRGDLRLIADLIPDGSRVLDLGCGDGALLDRCLHLEQPLRAARLVVEQDDLAGHIARVLLGRAPGAGVDELALPAHLEDQLWDYLVRAAFSLVNTMEQP